MDHIKKALGSIRIGVEEKQGVCPKHGPFASVLLFNSAGEPFNTIQCPHCTEEQQAAEKAKKEALLVKARFRLLAQSLGIPETCTGLRFADIKRFIHSRQIVLLQNLLRSHHALDSSYQVRISGGTDLLRTQVGSALLLEAIRHTPPQTHPSVLCVPLDALEVKWTPHKGEEFFNLLYTPKLLFLDEFELRDEYIVTFHNLLSVVIRQRSINRRMTIIGRANFDPDIEVMLNPRGGRVFPIYLGGERDA